MTDQLLTMPAPADPALSIAAQGLAGEFHALGVLDWADLHPARQLTRLYGERDERVHSAHRRELVAHVGRKEREPEVREIDDVQQPPGEAEAHPEQAVEAADEDAGERRLREQRRARERHCTASVAPGAAYSFG